MMTADGAMVDGSWELTILVTDLQAEHKLRVKGDLHIGGLIHRLVERMELQMDWSDHGLWWPEKNMWLTRWRSTLDKYNVQADSTLLFTPMHKNLRVQLPDLQILDMKADFSQSVFKVVVRLCKELGIRYPEELSLSRKLEREELKKNRGMSATRRPQHLVPQSPSAHNMSGNSYDGTHSPHMPRSPASRSPMTPSTPQGTLMRTPGTPGSGYMTMSPSYNNGTMTPGSMNSLAFEGAMESSLANSPMTPTREGLLMLYRPKTFAEKARINAGWIDSSLSLMEQGIKENQLMLLKFKFYSYYDLNPKYDAVRINQLYEQAKWSLMSEEIDCTEDEMMMFAALQFQVQLQSSQPQPDLNNTNHTDEDDIDAALDTLQVSLEGSAISHSDITRVPELADYLKYFKPKKFTLKGYKRHWFTFKDNTLSMYKSQEDQGGEPVLRVNLKGCEVHPEINLSASKFCIKLFLPSEDGMTETWIRADTEEQYAKWMAAMKLASKGKTMADSSYEPEVQSIVSFLQMQRPKQVQVDPSQVDIKSEDFVAPRFFRRIKMKHMATRILEAHTNVRDMTLLDAKMSFIKAWQELPDFGITYFIIRCKSQKKEELLGVASNRLIKMDLNSGDTNKTWSFSSMQSWSVNWEIKQVQVAFEGDRIDFYCLTADCKIVHEYIGGYIFLSMRSGDKSQTLDEEMFQKLTGGWD